MTGCIFVQACSYLGIDFKLHSPSENLAHNEKLCKHVNHLYLSWINGDIIDLSTGNKVAELFGTNYFKKKYLNILFENVVLIWGFPSKLKAREIRECVSKVFGPTSVTSVYHLDETAVFVQFSKPEFVSDFLLLKETLEKSDGPISVLHPLAKLLEGGNTHAGNYETYKEICSSPISKVLFANQAEAVGSKRKREAMEPKIAVESKEHSSFWEENAVNNSTKSSEKSKQGKVHNAKKDMLGGNYEIIDSLYAAEVNQIRTNNLWLWS